MTRYLRQGYLWLACYASLAIVTQLNAQTRWRDELLRIISFDTYNENSSHSIYLISNNIDDDPRQTEWVRELMSKYVELNWYCVDRYSSHFTGPPPQNTKQWSKQILGAYNPDFDQAVLRVWALRAIHKGSYEAYSYFIMNQNQKQKLSYPSFLILHQRLSELIETCSWINKDYLLQSLETAAVLLDIGHTEKARTYAQKYKVTCTNADYFLDETLNKCPQIYPSFKRLPFPCQELLQHSTNLINLKHFRKLQGGPSVLSSLIEQQRPAAQSEYFQTSYILNIIDSAAWEARESIDGCLNYDEVVHACSEIALKACKKVLDCDDAYQIYMDYLSERAKFLNLDHSTPIGRVLTRLGCFLDFKTAQEGIMLKESFSRLNIIEQARIIAQFDIRKDDPIKFTPLYLTTIIKTMYTNKTLGEDPKIRLNKAFVLTLPFISRALEDHRSALQDHRHTSTQPLNFRHILTIVRDNPYVLNCVEHTVDKYNFVHTKYKEPQ